MLVQGFNLLVMVGVYDGEGGGEVRYQIRVCVVVVYDGTLIEVYRCSARSLIKADFDLAPTSRVTG